MWWMTLKTGTKTLSKMIPNEEFKTSVMVQTMNGFTIKEQSPVKLILRRRDHESVTYLYEAES